MAAHSIWNGSISFGLVTIPVSLRSAARDHALKFSLLDKRDLSPVGNLHINKRTRKEVAWKDVVKGYQYKKGKYVVLTPEDFSKANVKASQLLEIEDFVDMSEVDPIYFDQPYYIVPTAQGARAYSLLLQVLSRTQKIGIGRVVMHTKQHLVAVVPMGKVLLLEVMRFAHEILTVKDLDIKSSAGSKVTDREVAMAEQLVKGLTSEWDPDKYEDTYHDDLLRLINKKIKRGATQDIEPYNAPSPDEAGEKGKLLDLMPLLKASLRRGRGAAKDKEDDEEEAADTEAAQVVPIARKRAKKASPKQPAKRQSARAKPAARKAVKKTKSGPPRRAAAQGAHASH